MANGTTVTMTTFDALLKNIYVDKKNLWVMDAFKNTLLTSVTKRTDATGKNWNQPVIDTSVAGQAAQYAQARANATAGQDYVFQGLWKEKYGALFLDEKAIRMSISKEGAIDAVLANKIDSVRRIFNQSTEYQMFRDEGGSVGIGVTGSIYNTTSNTGFTVTLSTNTGIPASQYIKINDILDYSSFLNGSNLTGSVTVTQINVNGTFVVTGSTPGGAGGSTANYTQATAGTSYSNFMTALSNAGGQTGAGFPVYLFKQGDAQGSTTTTQATSVGGPATAQYAGIPLAGLASWIPATDPGSSDSFKGIGRYVDPRGLGGIRIAASQEKLTEAYMDGVAAAGRFGGEPDLVLTHTNTYIKLSKELQGQQRYAEGSFKGRPAGGAYTKGMGSKFAFKTLTVANPVGGDLQIAPAWACQTALSWVLTTKHFTLWTNGPWPDLRGRDGLTLLRQSDTSYIYELLGYGELICAAPGLNACVIHDTSL